MERESDKPPVRDVEEKGAGAVTAEIPPQVTQLHNECLNAMFREGYYKKLHASTVRYAKIFDFSIALGSAASGGTGLGILADPRFGWICGVVTTISVLLSVAKGVWGWDAKTKFALERVQFYSDLGSKYMALVDDVNAAAAWNPEFQARRAALRANGAPTTPDSYPELSKQTQQEVQDAIKASVPYTTWWGWSR